jgi:hypothetical protein
VISAEVNEEAIAVADVLVDSGRHEPFSRQVVDIGLELQRAGSASRERYGAIATAAWKAVGGGRRSASVVENAEDLIVKDVSEAGMLANVAA